MRQPHEVSSRITGATAACLGGLTLAMLLSGCGTAITRTTLTPPLAGMGSYKWTLATINDGAGGPIATCTPPTPPAPSLPTPPNPGEVLVGYQDWRNTVLGPPGVMCPNSRASRWHGLMVFEMAAVAADLQAVPYKLLTATLSYRIGSWLKVPPSAQDLDLCVRTLELARGYETPAPFALVDLDPLLGGFPQSAPSRLGVINMPTRVPFGQVTTTGPVSIDPAAPNPTVTVDVSLLLSDWVERLAQEPPNSRERSRFGVALLPFGPSIQQLGLTQVPPSPVPASRATARCTSILKDPRLTVIIGR